MANNVRLDAGTPALYENTVYCANQNGTGKVFANNFTARRWDWQGGGWLDASLTYDDIVALKQLLAGGGATPAYDGSVTIS